MKFRRIEDADIPVCLEWYNWYIRNSMATFETKELTLISLSSMSAQHMTGRQMSRSISAMMLVIKAMELH